MKNSILTLFYFFIISTGISQSIYDISNITIIDIEFEESNWDEIMDTYYDNELNEKLIGSCTINGFFYDSIGVAYKGNSTYSPENLKNPLNIKLNTIINQSFQGYSTFKLSNGKKDPSFVREVLSYEIARDYMDVPLANYAKVSINGAYYGLFTSVESINGNYQERRLFCDDDNTRFKCNPKVVIGGGSSLEYLGTDASLYFNKYELKSDLGWSDMVDFTYQLQSNILTIEDHLDVDRAIWMLAFNIVLVNLDSYTGPFKQNYYMIKDDNDRFLPILWDLNQSLGSFPVVGEGGPPELVDLTEMSLFLRIEDESYPLISKLLSIPRYRKMYVAHVKTMLSENFSDGSYYTRAEEIQTIIATEVSTEPNGFYTPSEFTSNLYETEGGTGGTGPGSEGVFGISEVMEPRVAYLESLPVFSFTAPTISEIETSPASITPYATVTITATITDVNYAYLGYRNDWQDAFKKIEMFDDGAHGDGAADDNVYGVSFVVKAKDIQYYIYADNDLAGKFSPVRAEHEFYSIIIHQDVVINEIMSENSVTITDQDDEYDDWLELYNTTDFEIDLSGYYLTDRPNAIPLKWKFPESTIIAANDYLIIWLDKDTLQDGLHANFKLTSSGESILFSDPGGFELSRVKFPEMYFGTTYGRYPNATGPFMRMFPTYAANNSYTALSINEVVESSNYLIYPNPANESVTLIFDSEKQETIKVYNLVGKLIHQSSIYSTTQINISDWATGVYLIVLPELNITTKFIKK